MNKLNITNFDGTPVLLTTKDVAKILECSEPTARQMMRRDDFPLLKVGKNYKVDLTSFDDWCKGRHI